MKEKKLKNISKLKLLFFELEYDRRYEFHTAYFLCVPGMALIQLEINQPQVFTAKCNEPQVVVSDGKDGGSGVVILLSVRTET